MKMKENKITRVVVDGNVAIKPYLYIRNKNLHVRFTCDKCVELTDAELSTLYKRLNEHPESKQDIFAEVWSVVANLNERPVKDGIKVADRLMDEKRQSDGQ
jgi:hypothetical protein